MNDEAIIQALFAAIVIGSAMGGLYGVWCRVFPSGREGKK